MLGQGNKNIYKMDDCVEAGGLHRKVLGDGAVLPTSKAESMELCDFCIRSPGGKTGCNRTTLRADVVFIFGGQSGPVFDLHPRKLEQLLVSPK